MWTDPWEFRDRFFEQIDKEFSEAEDMLNRMFRTARETGTTTSQTSPYFYGYQITIGPEGKPHIREFGNIRPSSKGLIEQSAVRQPLVDTRFNEKENTMVITAEMPGITKEDVKVSMEEGLVTIHAEKGNKKYHTELPVEKELDTDSTKAELHKRNIGIKDTVQKISEAKIKRNKS